MIAKTKIQALIHLSAALAALFLLSTGLASLQLQPAIPFSLRAELQRMFAAWARPETGLLRWALVLGVLLLFGLYRRKPGRRAGVFAGQGLIFQLIASVVTILVFLLLSRLLMARTEDLEGLVFEPTRAAASLATGTPAAAFPTGGIPAPRFSTGLPAWMPLAFSGFLALLAAGLAAGIYLAFRRRDEAPAFALDRLGEEARGAVEALTAGQDVKDIVIRSYLQMGEILAEERGIRRSAAMTPEEFQARLVQLGFPEEPVRRLTGLFERVRYGAQQPGEAEQRQAIASLSAIAAHCRQGGRAA